MASTNKTELLKLPQWNDGDKLEMTDLNDAFEKVDTGLTTHLAEDANKHIHSSGNNENGYWIKFDDGTQICRHIIKFIDLPITQAWGSGFIGYIYGLNYYPSAFTAPPSVTTTVVGNDGALVLSVENLLDRLGVISLFRAVSITADINLSYVAIGRWK